SILSAAQISHLSGELEYPSLNAKGTVSICAAGGNGAFISAAAYDAISEANRPPVSLTQGPKIFTLLSEVQTLGSTVVPLAFAEKHTGRKFRVELRALVVPGLLTDMFI
ncbi:hypothetical protein AOQ84DRAFT_276840, partial [Glonium stellatum]